MKIAKILVVIAVISLIGFFGIFGIKSYQEKVREGNKKAEEAWQKSSEPIIAQVLAESYQNTLIPNPKWDGAFSYSNETVKLEAKYMLGLETNEGKELGLSVIDSASFSPETKEALDAIVHKGTWVCFPKGNLAARGNWDSQIKFNRETYVAENTQMVTKWAFRIKVLNNEELPDAYNICKKYFLQPNKYSCSCGSCGCDSYY